jgi:hypothetical protein
MIARERREGGEAAGHGGNHAAARLGGAARGRRKEGEEGRLTGGPRLSAPWGKKKKRGGGEVGWRGRWVGPLGPKGSRCGFCFFFFSFSKLLFQTIFLFKFKSNSFKLFLNNL